MCKIEGIAASPDITMGLHCKEDSYHFCRLVDKSQRAKEKERFLAAQQAAEIELTTLLERSTEKVEKEQAEVLATHKEMVSAPSFSNSILALIHRNHASAEAAVEDTVNEIISMLILLDNTYMLQRAVDIQKVGNRLLCHLQLM
jgi:phosphotransferase system enzyme I (PtsI)